MNLGLAYWIIMLVWLLFWGWNSWHSPSPLVIGGNLIVFVLFLLLGWKTFGAPLHG